MAWAVGRFRELVGRLRPVTVTAKRGKTMSEDELWVTREVLRRLQEYEREHGCRPAAISLVRGAIPARRTGMAGGTVEVKCVPEIPETGRFYRVGDKFFHPR